MIIHPGGFITQQFFRRQITCKAKGKGKKSLIEKTIDQKRLQGDFVAKPKIY